MAEGRREGGQEPILGGREGVGGGPTREPSSQSQHMLHCPIERHLQNTELKTKSFRIEIMKPQDPGLSEHWSQP